MTCAAPASVCKGAGVCDSTTGTCSYPNLADNTPCDDQNGRTTDLCQSGQCVGSNKLEYLNFLSHWGEKKKCENKNVFVFAREWLNNYSRNF